MAVVGLACVLLGLTVVWRGEVSETAAGLWPPAGVALAAFMVIPPRRWGWVAGGVLVPTAIGLTTQVVAVTPALLWGVGNCVGPAVAALLLRRFSASRWFPASPPSGWRSSAWPSSSALG